MSVARTFAKPSIMTWAGNKISDHNRDAVSIENNRIEDSQRMANGTLRKYVVADKATFSTSWTDLPHNAMYTVDGFWGKNEMENFYYTTPGAFELKLFFGDDTSKTYQVMLTKWSAEISKRGAFDFWKVTVEMQEV